MLTYQVSIHTLTQRVTWAQIAVELVKQSFNPHPHAEGDQEIIPVWLQLSKFQSTPSRRGWRCPAGKSISDTGFNPHPHAEGDSNLSRVQLSLLTFQSTPSRRGWLFYVVHGNSATAVSIHTLTQRVTSFPQPKIFDGGKVSIHTLTQRVTQYWPLPFGK